MLRFSRKRLACALAGAFAPCFRARSFSVDTDKFWLWAEAKY